MTGVVGEGATLAGTEDKQVGPAALAAREDLEAILVEMGEPVVTWVTGVREGTLEVGLRLAIGGQS